MKTIILVDDHPIVRHGLKQIITQTGEFEVVAEAEEANEAFRLIMELQPDIACIDLSLKGMGGIELIKWIRGNGFKNPILVISMHDEAVYAERALKAGANGYVMKQEAPDTVIAAIKAVINGDVYISASMSQRVLKAIMPGKGGKSGIEKLSDRELEVFRLFGKGLRVQEIATELGISAKTVETYQANMKQKLGLESASELSKYAIDVSYQGFPR
ncbi:MAG: response regulator transcription factor [Fibrobacteres bacterium]|nr:response regulator transcription factor [Fibrobacterota bacterium]